MHYIVETQEQLEKLGEKLDSCFINLISNNDNQHPRLAKPSLLYIRPVSENKGYIVVLDHSEGFSLNILEVAKVLSKASKIYCLNSKYHSYYLDLSLIDLNYCFLERGEKPMENRGDSPLINIYYQRYTGVYKDINRVIPISKLYEYWEELYIKVETCIKTFRLDLEFYSQYEKVYKKVEEAGLKIDTQCFGEFFTPHSITDSYEDQIIYTNYNLYNVTARPTNAFNGINFLALNKENHSRKCFIPQNHYFVEFDFDAYHVRLIANLINFELPEDQSIHTYFAKQYFNRDTITEEEYKEAKQITFQNIYGGIKEEYREIPFYKALSTYLDDLWNTYQYGKGVQLPTGRTLQVSEDIYLLKLFNYFIQNLETKTNVELLTKLQAILEGKKSFISLVVYDSFLLDFNVEDGKELLLEIVSLLRESKYPVKAKYGKDYDSLMKTNYL